jgi:multidrug efflux pump subunit AcrA (membrane-fusion protein)
MEMKSPRLPVCAAPNGRTGQGAIVVSHMAFALLAFTALSGCEQNNFVPPPPPKVDVGLPVQQNVTRYLDATGNTAPIQTVDLVARVQGVLESINYKDGSFVKAGPGRRGGCAGDDEAG